MRRAIKWFFTLRPVISKDFGDGVVVNYLSVSPFGFAILVLCCILAFWSK